MDVKLSFGGKNTKEKWSPVSRLFKSLEIFWFDLNFMTLQYFPKSEQTSTNKYIYNDLVACKEEPTEEKTFVLILVCLMTQ